MTPFGRFLLTLALTLCWSPSYLFIKFAIEDIPPFTVVALRVGFSFLIFFAILLARKQFLPANMRFWMHATAMAVISSAFPYTMFCIAEQSIDSALTAILTGGSTMCTALLAHALIPSDRLNVAKITGIGLSFFGILLLFAPNLMNGVSGTAFGMTCAIGAAISYGASHVYGKMFFTGFKPFVAPTAQMLVGTILMGSLAFWHDAPLSLPMPSATAMFGVFGLVFFCTICAFTIYYKLLEHSGATAISMVACFFPIGGMALGFLFLDETFTVMGVVAAVLILTGMMLVNGVIKLPSKETEPETVQELA